MDSELFSKGRLSDKSSFQDITLSAPAVFWIMSRSAPSSSLNL
jgi:hypothetical protein